MLSVTEAIRLSGLSESLDFVPATALHRGRAVHHAVHLDETGTLDEGSLHPEVAPRLESWRLWRRAVNLSFLRGEFEVVGIGYVGHPDVVGMIAGKQYVIDVKNGSPAPWHAIQTALYGLAICRSLLRGAVYLQADGTIAKFVPHLDRDDYAVGLAAVTVASWKKRNGL